MTQHAYLSASSAHRWLNCTNAPKIESKFADNGSKYAQEGTRAHAVAEYTLQEYKRTGRVKLPHDIDAEMRESLTNYVNYVVETLSKAKNYEFLIEAKLDFSEYVPDGFGTGDVVIISDSGLEIIDLKYGKGVEVSAVNNPQMMLYALGAYEWYNPYFDIDEVTMTIYQPRIDNISSYSMKIKDLIAWGENVVKPKAKEAFNGTGSTVAGKHCKFCKARFECKTLADYNLSIYRPKDLLTDDEIATILEQADDVKNWLQGLQDYALTKALEGNDFKGFKLVEGRSNRKIIDQDEAAKRLVDLGFKDVYKPVELKTLTALEKEVGKKKLGEVLDGLIIKPQGKPCLVPLDDKREPMQFVKAEDYDDDLL